MGFSKKYTISRINNSYLILEVKHSFPSKYVYVFNPRKTKRVFPSISLTNLEFVFRLERLTGTSSFYSRNRMKM